MPSEKLSDRQWEVIRSLEGQELRTIGRKMNDQGEPFTIRCKTETLVMALPRRGKPRPVRRDRFDQALSLGVPIHQLRPSMLEDVPPKMVCTSYVVAILRELRRRGEM
jgi:hypothetical protein